MSSFLRLHLREGLGWQTTGNACARGSAFQGGRLLNAGQLAGQLSVAISAEQFRELVTGLNGFFSAVTWRDEVVHASVDHARSMPLFYAGEQGLLYVSDDASWIAGQLGGIELDTACAREYALAGYVTGADTLDRRIHQLQAGESLCAVHAAGQLELRTTRWFRFKHVTAVEWDESELVDRMHAVLQAACERLVHYAGGRLIAVPLSAGYDSRSIVLMLRRLGCENVLAFSYGRPGHAEAEVSRSIAGRLGFNWEFVPYSEERWKEWFMSADRRAYYALADNLSSLPVMQDWPAVGELKRRGVLTHDAVIVPGYSADAFPRSRKSPGDSPVFASGSPDRETVLDAIIDYTYSLWNWSKQQRELRRLVEARIDKALDSLAEYDSNASAIEAWGIQERQGKFINNAVRAYEFWGFDWWLPLWDRDFVDYWMKVPVRYRVERRFSRTQIARLEADTTGEQFVPPPDPRAQSSLQALAVRLRRLGQRIPLVAALYDFVRARAKYATHPLAWHGMIPRPLFTRSFRGRVNINSYLALQRLGWISFDEDEASKR